MPSMPYYFIGKGSQFTLLDELFGVGDEGARQGAFDAALERLDSTPLGELAGRHTDRRGATRLSEGDVRHFKAHWLRAWWPDHDVEDIMRAGFKEALTRARDAGLPLEALWVCADEKVFQVYINQGPHQVTVLVFTPPPSEHVADETLTAPENIWVVKQRDKWDKGEFEVLEGERKGGDIIQKRLMYDPGPSA